jgi:hypothetical protein
MKDRIHNGLEFRSDDDVMYVHYIERDYSGRACYLVMFNGVAVGDYRTWRGVDKKISSMCLKHGLSEVFF